MTHYPFPNPDQDNTTLVIGTAMPEGIVGRYQERTQLGGVAGIMAQELAAAGENPLLITPQGNDDNGRHLAVMLQDLDLRHCLAPNHHPGAWSRISLDPAVKTAGNWPTWGWYYPLKNLVEQAFRAYWTADRSQPRPFAVVDCSLATAALTAINDLAIAHHWNLVINATTKFRCSRAAARRADLWDSRICAVTANRQETQALLQMCGSRDDIRALMRTMATQYFLSTRDREGWELYGPDGQYWSSPALTRRPAGSDFIGAGDAATAGFIHALKANKPFVTAINAAISERLEFNHRSNRRRAA